MTDRAGSAAMGLILGALCGIAVVLCLGSQTSCKPGATLGGPQVENHPDRLTVKHGGTLVSVVVKGNEEAQGLIESLQSDLEECRFLLGSQDGKDEDREKGGPEGTP